MPGDPFKCHLTFVWDEEDECWSVKVGDCITVKFWDGNSVVVAGSLLKMSITYDQITEERGILFQEDK